MSVGDELLKLAASPLKRMLVGDPFLPLPDGSWVLPSNRHCKTFPDSNGARRHHRHPQSGSESRCSR